MADVRLDELLGGYTNERAVRWLRGKFDFEEKGASLPFGDNKTEQELFSKIERLGYVRRLPEVKNGAVNRPIVVIAVHIKKILHERLDRLAQFNCAKRLLKVEAAGAHGCDGLLSQGFFFFYDDDGNFRLSLLTANIEKKRIVFNNAKRQSFSAFTDRANNIFRHRLGNDLKTFEEVQNAFSVEALTREFYNELFNWYVWATDENTKITFPNDTDTDNDDRDNLAEAMIRLVTRLMFVWFLREKGLVPKVLFDETGVKEYLRDFDPKSMDGDSYYRAILQNLFFATLNTPPEDRGFAGKGSSSFMVKTKWRSKEELCDLGRFQEELSTVPFLNCSLFDCLDRVKEERGKDGKLSFVLLDGFSNEKKRSAFVPNGYLFGDGREHHGIITLLSQYEFTIDENSHDDADIALDPELLGKVFENLLGAYNPETKETARKATGSFYTPREIVDYMVGESLRQYLQRAVPTVTDGELDELFDKTRSE